MALSTEEKTDSEGIDPATGLPELPKNYFWDIQLTGEKGGLIVRLKKHTTTKEHRSHWVFWTKWVEVPDVDLIDYEYIWVEQPAGDILSKEGVQEAILDKANKIIRKRRLEWDRSDLLSPFVGKYPPKNLNQL